jgi:hypothetical protein
VDRGIGPLTLGESKAATRLILGNGERGPGELTVFSGHYRARKVRLVSLYSVGYTRKGKIQTLISIAPELRVSGRYIERADPDASAPEDHPVLSRWRKGVCGGVTVRENHRLMSSATTAVGLITGRFPYEIKTIVIVSASVRTVCAPGGMVSHLVRSAF